MLKLQSEFVVALRFVRKDSAGQKRTRRCGQRPKRWFCLHVVRLEMLMLTLAGGGLWTQPAEKVGGWR